VFDSKRKRILKLIISFLGIVFLIIFGVEFVSSFSGEFYLNNPLFHLLFALIIILIIVLFAIFIKNLILFFYPKFRTNLRFKIFSAFVLLILGPALLTIFISSGVVNKGLDRLLRIQVKRIVNLSYETSKDFLNFTSKDLERIAKQISKEFARYFFKFIVTVHPQDIVGEMPGKGSNETWAIRQVKKNIIDISYQGKSFRILMIVFLAASNL